MLIWNRWAKVFAVRAVWPFPFEHGLTREDACAAAKPEVIRRILDEALGIGKEDDDTTERAVIEATTGLCTPR